MRQPQLLCLIALLGVSAPSQATDLTYIIEGNVSHLFGDAEMNGTRIGERVDFDRALAR